MKLDDMIDEIARINRIAIVRDMLYGKINLPEGAEAMALLQADIDEGRWPEGEEDLDEILGPDEIGFADAAD